MTKYQPESVDAWFIDTDEEWCVIKLMGAWTLCYTQLDKRNMKPKPKALGVAFANTRVMRRVAEHLVRMADLQDSIDGQTKCKEALK